MGVDPEQADGSGKSARQWAEETYQTGLLEILDPQRNSAFWNKYGSKDLKSYVGIWSNHAGRERDGQFDRLAGGGTAR